ncbi:MAG: hypothetical protein ACI3YC_00100 [Alloprevotella sp.]
MGEFDARLSGVAATRQTPFLHCFSVVQRLAKQLQKACKTVAKGLQNACRFLAEKQEKIRRVRAIRGQKPPFPPIPSAGFWTTFEQPFASLLQPFCSLFAAFLQPSSSLLHSLHSLSLHTFFPTQRAMCEEKDVPLQVINILTGLINRLICFRIMLKPVAPLIDSVRRTN